LKFFKLVLIFIFSIGIIICIAGMWTVLFQKNVPVFLNVFSETLNTPNPTKFKAIKTPAPTLNQHLLITAVGDINLGRVVGQRIESNGGDYKEPFSEVRDILREGDIIFANLEIPLTNSDKGLDKRGKIVLKASPNAIDGLKYAGFNILSIANNHIMDYYDTGLKDTMAILNKNGINYIGAGENEVKAREPIFISKNGLHVAILAYTEMADIVFKGTPYIKFAAGKNSYGVASLDLENITLDVTEAKKNADIVLVSLHWGVEYVNDLRPGQQEIARSIIDAGADGILGHHPHTIKGVELYKGKPIIYSMGNFIFDQNDPNNQESFIFTLEYNKDGLKSMKATPIRTIDKSHISLLDKYDGELLMKKEVRLSNELNTQVEVANNVLKFKIP
jgi:poly-gamma-glutamate capsule biosynthesis protein CapA/YwtB (metallophosphatase superfamily)